SKGVEEGNSSSSSSRTSIADSNLNLRISTMGKTGLVTSVHSCDELVQEVPELQVGIFDKLNRCKRGLSRCKVCRKHLSTYEPMKREFEPAQL
ncbi:hypothetical protein A2U01_0006172, partial [Trifolium medium]|nr:hypothetical protein [Trifolium medium]